MNLRNCDFQLAYVPTNTVSKIMNLLAWVEKYET